MLCVPQIRTEISLILLLLFVQVSHTFASIADAPYQNTLDTLVVHSLLQEDDADISREIVKTLSYAQQRGLRAFCLLADINDTNVHDVIEQFSQTVVSFETILLLEKFVQSPQATISLCWQLIELLSKSSLVAKASIKSLLQKEMTPPVTILRLAHTVQQLKGPGQWATKALFEREDSNTAILIQCVTIIASMSPQQQWACEKLLQKKSYKSETIVTHLQQIARLSPSETSNLTAILEDSKQKVSYQLHWLENFFGKSASQKDQLFLTLSAERKDELLSAYDRAASDIVKTINSLHDVTNKFGREMSNGYLETLSFDELTIMFEKLHPQAYSTWEAEMRKASATNKKRKAVDILHQATALARKKVAGDLTLANLYVLLANGNELYTSSFRSVLVPVLQQRLNSQHDNNLVEFITTTDPENRYSTQFITNLAWKASLTQLLSRKSGHQKDLLDLVTNSAFRDEYSLLLFSATFSKVINALLPEARSYLIELMITASRDNNQNFAKQIQLILQYYQTHHLKILNESDRLNIHNFIAQNPEINTTTYQQTPFTEWTEDNKLKSLSVFQKDDDGRSSYLSNCHHLFSKGYLPEISNILLPDSVDPEQVISLQSTLKKINDQTTFVINETFRLAAIHSIVIDWKKTVNKIDIVHSLAVYQKKKMQEQLLHLFLNRGYEMFAQRGHSYWRHNQLLNPLKSILNKKDVDPTKLQKQRFISLGSCGGIRAYLELNRLFSNRVDILATVGTGQSTINNPYNITLFEIVAKEPTLSTWDQVAHKTAHIFNSDNGKEYLQPGSLPALLHKMTYQITKTNGTD